MLKEETKSSSDKDSKPLMPYMEFVKRHRPELKQRYPDIPPKEIMKKCGEMWRELDESTKKSMQETYFREKAEYDKTHTSEKKNKKEKKEMKPKKIVEAKLQDKKKLKKKAVASID